MQHLLGEAPKLYKLYNKHKDIKLYLASSLSLGREIGSYLSR